MTRRACLTALLALSATSAFGAPSYNHLYAFGDSYSDNGGGQAFTKSLAAKHIKDAQELPGSLYWSGRWSNGQTAVEHLARSLDTPLTDYAIGGAKSGNGNYYSWMMPSRDTGVFGQIAEHLNAAQKHQADPEALYFIFISANDFFEWADFSHLESVDQLAHTSVANIRKATETLIAAGAKHMMVVGTTDLIHVPAVVQGNQVKNAAQYQQILQQKLPIELTKLTKTYQLDITFFDHVAFSNQLRADPSVAGLSNLDAPCQATYPDVRPACGKPDAYYYWDEWHPTRKIHALAGEAMLNSLSKRHPITGVDR